MSCRNLSLLAAAVLLLPLPAGAQGFEGIVRQRSVEVDEEALFERIYADSENDPEFDNETEWFRHVAAKIFAIPVEEWSDGESREDDLTLHVKGSKIRSSDASATGYMVMDLATMTTWMVEPAGRWYVEIRADEAQQEAEDMMARMGIDPDELPAGDYGEGMETVHFAPESRSLDRREEVNGFPATLHEAQAGSELGIGWCAEDTQDLREAFERITDGIGALGMGDEESPYDAPAQAGPVVEDILCEAGLPVRAQILRFGAGGGFSYTITDILRVEQVPVADELLQIPDGYTKRSLQDLWR